MKFIEGILSDVKTVHMDQFTLNFQRKAFFDRPWVATKYQNKRGSLLMRTGALRRGMKARIDGKNIHFISDLPYASIQNNGGTITVTAAMKRYFWARHYQAAGARTKSRSANGQKRNRVLSQEAQFWKNMALMPVGKPIKVPKRQFMGFHPSMDPKIKQIVDRRMDEVSEYIKGKLKR